MSIATVWTSTGTEQGDGKVARGGVLQECGSVQMSYVTEGRGLTLDCDDMEEGCALCVVYWQSDKVAWGVGTGNTETQLRIAELLR